MKTEKKSHNEYCILHHLKNHKRFIGSCTYQDFQCETIKPFKNLPGGARSYLWEINEATQLNYITRGKKVSEKF